MDIATILSLGQTALELGLICSLTVLALYLSYSMLNVCDLSTDGCFTLGAAVGAIVVISGHPYLAIPAAMAAGVCSGFVTAILQTKLGVDSLLSGIIVNTGLYSINIAIMGGSSLLNMNKVDTVFSLMKDLLKGTVFAKQYKLAVALIAVTVILVLLTAFSQNTPRPCHPRNGQQSRHGPLIVNKHRFHDHHRSVHRRLVHGAVRLPAGAVAEGS